MVVSCAAASCLNLRWAPVGGPGRQRRRFNRDDDQVGGDQAGAGDGVVARRSVDDYPVLERLLTGDFIVHVFTGHSDNRKGLVLAQARGLPTPARSKSFPDVNNATQHILIHVSTYAQKGVFGGSSPKEGWEICAIGRRIGDESATMGRLRR